ncbi:DUF6907 domain-containing protein [Streptomyces pseudogriseolus]|uniref:DUF6907 domain-containing protein n=1 Tax=Streptomyces pseudogriseolus TaxID=36817 RepID=UPI003FA22E8A
MPDPIRTITLRTADHGPVTIPEPSWCVSHETLPGDLRADIVHLGPDAVLKFRGRELSTASLVQAPFGDDTTPGVSVSLLGRTLDARAVYELAAALDGYADRLRDLADQLLVIAAEGDL